MRETLLRAAGELVAERGGVDWSLGEAASRAGVTAAMVGYYFASKRGFLEALLESGFAPILSRLEGAAGEAEPDLEALLSELLGAVSERPWLPVLMLRTVLGGDALRDAFASRFGPRIAAAGGRLLREARRRGIVRTDTDPGLTLLCVLSMSVFPFLARPVVERVLQLPLDERFAARQAAHVARLLSPASR